MAGTNEEEQPIPNTIVNHSTGTSYVKQRFFGKGGFAKCYEIQDSRTKGTFAGKIVSKKTLTRENQREKMVQEIEIHKSLSHRNVVKFYSFFEDSNFVYVILELCTKRSMMELHKRRKALTEPEVRYFMKQILEGVSYLHDLKIIHRDLKLGNLFLSEDLVVKIGDFGLAARIEFYGQRKKTLCGTPNYIAPEVLNKQGHGLEVDVWSIGCIMYTLIVGKPPFETSSLRETYAKIKRCDYVLPPNLDQDAAHMIHQMLLPNPMSRPKTRELLRAEFLQNGFCPRELPPTVLTTAPKFKTSPRKPLVERNAETIRDRRMPKKSVMASSSLPVVPTSVSQQCHQYMQMLKAQLVGVLSKNIKSLPYATEEMTDPNAQPFVWVSKWVDYSDKYGFGYQLCDDGVGVMFNDNSRILILPNMINIHYIEQNGTENYYTMNATPPELEKKVKLLSYFRRYMSEHLMKAGDSVRVVEKDNMSRVPYLHQWNRSSRSVLMQLTNGTVQINFMDHTKIIMCPLMQAVTHIDEEKRFRTYRFSTIVENGVYPKLQDSLQYAYYKISSLLKSSPDSGKDI